MAEAIWGSHPISARRLRVLVEAMPPGGAFAFATGAVIPGWSVTDELLAIVAELVSENTRAFVIAHSKKGTPAPKPLRIPRPKRPGDEEPTRRLATPEEIAAFFGGRVRYTGGKPRCPRGHFVKAGQACARCNPALPLSPMDDHLT